MIIDFADEQAALGADVLLDLWDDMPHDFQALDSERLPSSAALARIRAAILWHSAKQGDFGPGPATF